MLNKTYRILKYIHKNPMITKSELLTKFSDFEKYEKTIEAYVTKENANKDVENDTKSDLLWQAAQLKIPVGEQENYLNEHMPDVHTSIDNSLITYSTNFTFEEYFEKKRHNALLFWLPYGITTFIAGLSLLLQIIHYLFSGTP